MSARGKGGRSVRACEKQLQKNSRWRPPNVRENARCGVRACEPVEAVVALELAVHLFNVFPGGAFRRGHVPSTESAQLPMPRGAMPVPDAFDNAVKQRETAKLKSLKRQKRNS